MFELVGRQLSNRQTTEWAEDAIDPLERPPGARQNLDRFPQMVRGRRGRHGGEPTAGCALAAQAVHQGVAG
ncbi:MAG: hypothetical protein J2P58_13520 [Acidimicrobiaceae bacterium]|nr:hypothetical protein [Acidimicrobiaceae bacterium]MBO0714091.1 hypothetical protein [Acidimicrobiales bacterium]